MHLIFSNPAGWWALLGLPVLVLIHFLQRQSRRVEVSTLFLLERQEVESRAGRRLERWRNSLLFWLQALAIVLLAWMLGGPRWIDAGTVQRIALVLDSSLAMEAFRPQLQSGLTNDTATLARGANRTQWLLLESDLSRPPLYQGEDRSALLKAVAVWQANLGPHDPTQVLRAARAAVGNEGLVLFVTYHPPVAGTLPVDAHVLAYGHVLDNVGVAAATAELHEGQPLWRVLVRNNSATSQKRAWWIESNGQRSPSQNIALEPGATQALQGAFPPNAEHVVFALQPDDFTLDDRAPLVLPQPKILTLAFNAPDDFVAFLKPVLSILGDVKPADPGEKADLLFNLSSTVPPTPEGTSRIVFIAQPTGDDAAETHAHPAAEKHPLMDGLNWSGLLYQTLVPLPPRPEDTTLMWDGSKPLIILRTPIGQGPTLILNFDPRHSNLLRLPAFVILVHRFAEEARSHKAAFARANFPSGESLALVLPKDAKVSTLETIALNNADDVAAKPLVTTLTPTTAAQVRAPSPPGFFALKVDGKPWLDAAALFPDPRESDFHDAAAIPLDARAQTMREEAHSHADTLTPLWLLILLAALLASWRETGKVLK